jgi:hypothetical protein
MANVGAARSKPGARRWAVAIACSLLANGLVAFLFWELRVSPVYDTTRRRSLSSCLACR